MTTDYNLGPLSHRDDPHTSRTAADSMQVHAGVHRTAILTALAFYGAKTAHEIAAMIGLDSVQVTRRLSELHDDGKVQRRETGTADGKPIYHTRKSPSGRPACVWYVKP